MAKKAKIKHIFGYQYLNEELSNLIARIQFLPEIAQDVDRFDQYLKDI